MTTYFVSNVGSNTAPYDTEAKAATAISTIHALPWTAADTVKVSSTHTETAGVAYTFTCPTTPGLKVVSVLFDGAGTGALSPGASINVGAVNAALNISSGFAYFNGVSFAAGTTANTACDLAIGAGAGLPIGFVFENCTFSVPAAIATAVIFIGPAALATNDDCSIRFANCIFNHGTTARSINLRYGNIYFDGCTLSGAVPTTVFLPTIGCPANVVITGCDLSNLAWTNLVDVSLAVPVLFVARQCKLRSGFAATVGVIPGPGACEVILQDCSAGDVQYTYVRVNYSGTITISGSIYCDASDGTNSFSMLMVSSANAKWEWPLVSPQLTRFNSGTAGVTARVEVVNDGVTFKDNELWLEVLAKVTAGFTLGTWDRSDMSSFFVTGANQPTSTAVWVGTGGFGAPVKQKLASGSFTPAEVGPIIGVVKLGKPSATVYVSPNLVVA